MNFKNQTMECLLNTNRNNINQYLNRYSSKYIFKSNLDKISEKNSRNDHISIRPSSTINFNPKPVMKNEIKVESPNNFNKKYKKMYENFIHKPSFVKPLDTYSKIKEMCPEMRNCLSSRNIKDSIYETKVNFITESNTRIDKMNTSMNKIFLSPKRTMDQKNIPDNISTAIKYYYLNTNTVNSKHENDIRINDIVLGTSESKIMNGEKNNSIFSTTIKSTSSSSDVFLKKENSNLNNKNYNILQKKNFSTLCVAKYRNYSCSNLKADQNIDDKLKGYKIDSNKIPSNVFFKIKKNFPEFVSKGDFQKKSPFNENSSKNKFDRIIEQTLYKK